MIPSRRVALRYHRGQLKALASFFNALSPYNVRQARKTRPTFTTIPTVAPSLHWNRGFNCERSIFAWSRDTERIWSDEFWAAQEGM